MSILFHYAEEYRVLGKSRCVEKEMKEMAVFSVTIIPTCLEHPELLIGDLHFSVTGCNFGGKEATIIAAS
jgi:hypothetical protein